jgi:hypothetical protein
VQGLIGFPAVRAHEVADRFREYLDTAPDEEALSFAFATATEDDPSFPPELAGQPVVLVGATHSGALDDASDVLRPLRDAGPLFDTFDVRRYLDVQALADEEMAWGKRFYMKGGFLAALSEGYVDLGLEQISAAPGDGCWIGLWAQGGAIALVADDAMAFTGREAPFWLGVEAAWDDPSSDEAHRNWGRVTMDSLSPYTAAGHYVNDMVETGNDIARGVYGPAKYDRLVELKRAFDPDNVFRLNQNIEP